MSGSRDDQPGEQSGEQSGASLVWVPDDAAGVLALAREQRAIADEAESRLLVLAVQWAVIHPAESVEEAETYRLHGTDTGIAVAGPGAPLVAEFSIAEFAVAVGVGTETGKKYVGHAVELRYRLKGLWARVVSGDLAAWKARQVADQTLHLSAEAAAYVDTHVAPVAHQVRPRQMNRLVEEAIARHMPAQAEENRQRAWDQRHFDVDFDAAGIAGTCPVVGELDLADAIDLNNAVTHDARTQADLGSPLTLDQRRSVALGNLARRDLLLDYPATDPAPVPRKSKKRDLVLHVHTSEAALTTSSGSGGAGSNVGRVENTRSPVLVETIRQWCGHPEARVIVKPVMDLAEHVSVDAYEIPDRISQSVALRDPTCMFPWCTRPTRKLRPDEHPADSDHHQPYAEGGPTCTCQIVPLCRRHHRLKTHGGWRYRILEPGSYLWTSPHHYQYLRDHTGTLDVSHDQHRRTPPPAAEPGET